MGDLGVALVATGVPTAGFIVVFLYMFRAMRSDIKDFKAELKSDIAKVETNLKSDIAKVETNLKSEIARVETSLRSDIKDNRSGIDQLRGQVSWLDLRIALIERHLKIPTPPSVDTADLTLASYRESLPDGEREKTAAASGGEGS